ncbi:MAG: hypothetical protein ACYC54_02970 [Sedimentisphaerales bacterium]
MARKVMLVVCLLSLSLLLGCQEKQKSASQINTIKQKQAKELKASIAGVSEDGIAVSNFYDMSPRDLMIAQNPGISNQQLYLSVVGKDGKPKECCKKPMRITIDNDGKLSLHCPHCGKLKPLAVKDGKVTVE